MASKKELQVKFKVDSTEVKKGADEAKQKVKQASQEMASDVKHSSDSMEGHLDKVSQSAKNIGTAAKDAGNGVKTLENQVNQSSNRMTQDLTKVADHLKKISSRQMGMIASRGMGIAANAIGWVGQNMTKEGSAERLYADVGQGALGGAASGAALGTMIAPGVGTAIGAAVGGLVGAGTTLYEAGRKLEEAAESQQKEAEDKLMAARSEEYVRNRNETFRKMNNPFLEELRNPSSPYRDKYYGVDRIYEEQRKREEALAKAQRELQEFSGSEATLATGGKALDNETTLDNLRHAVLVAQEKLQAFAPVVQEAAQVEAQFIAAEEAEVAAREEAARKVEEAARREAEAREKEHQVRIKSAESAIGQRMGNLAQQDRLNGFAQEFQSTLSKSGMRGVIEQQAKNKDALESAVKARDEYARANSGATGDEAIKVAQRLAELDQAVADARDRYKAFDPAVQESAKERQKQIQESMSLTQRELQGIISRPFMGGSPTDALTKIGGGTGYASFNNSTAQVQQRIESHLKSILALQKTQLQRIVDKLDSLQPSAGVWGP